MADGKSDMIGNRSPAVMFEIIARDQEAAKRFYGTVFGWTFDKSHEGFSYVHFGSRQTPLLGGIGQSIPDTPGMEPGHSFYFVVDDIEETLDRIVAAGGQRHMPEGAATSDRFEITYTFAMAKDPEGNVFGLVKPFDI